MDSGEELRQLVCDAEEEWLQRWGAGPTEGPPLVRAAGERAPDARLVDHSGTLRQLSDLWSDSVVLLMFWRHFGCGCGVMRSELLRNDWNEYRQHGILPVIVGQGEPARAAAYRAEHGLEAPILCDPDHDLYRAYGIGHWDFQKIMLSDPPAEYLADPVGWGAAIQEQRRAAGRPIVDDPWRAVADFVIGTDGVIKGSFQWEHCYDAPPSSRIIAAVTD